MRRRRHDAHQLSARARPRPPQEAARRDGSSCTSRPAIRKPQLNRLPHSPQRTQRIVPEQLSVTARISRRSRSARPPNGSMISAPRTSYAPDTSQPAWSSAAHVSMVKSRRLRSSRSSAPAGAPHRPPTAHPRCRAGPPARHHVRRPGRKNAPPNALAMARARRTPLSGTVISRSWVGRPSSRSRTKPPTSQAGSPRAQMKESTESIIVMVGRLRRIAKEQTAACQTQYASTQHAT